MNNRDVNGLPVSGPMATEPAKTIAQTFADRVMVKTIVAAIVAVVAGLLKVTVADDLVDNITTIVLFVAPMVLALIANMEQSGLAKEQGNVTREAVYSPATVAKIADKNYEAGLPPVEPQPDLPPPAGDGDIKQPAVNGAANPGPFHKRQD